MNSIKNSATSKLARRVGIGGRPTMPESVGAPGDFGAANFGIERYERSTMHSDTYRLRGLLN